MNKILNKILNRILIIIVLLLSLSSNSFAQERSFFGDFPSNQAFQIWVYDPYGYFGTGTTDQPEPTSPPSVQSALMELGASRAIVNSTYLRLDGTNTPSANYTWTTNLTLLILTSSQSISASDITVSSSFKDKDGDVGISGQVLKSVAGQTDWQTEIGGSGTPGGANTQVQYNDSGAFGGNSSFTFDETSGLITASGLSVTSVFKDKDGDVGISGQTLKSVAGQTDWQTDLTGGAGGFSIYVEEDDIAVANNSAADIYLDFLGADFDTGLVGNEVNVTVAGAITRDIEWDTEGEVQTAWGGVNIILATEIDTYAELDAIVGDAVLTHNGLIDTEAEFDALLFDVESEIAAGTTAQFYRGDKTFTGTLIGTLTSDGLTLGNNENLTFGVDTFYFDAVTSNDFELSDDLNINDTDPHIQLIPSSGDKFEIYAFGSELYCVNVTDGVILWKVKTNNDLLLTGEKKSISFVIMSPTATSDFPVWKVPYGITISRITVLDIGGTNTIGGLDSRSPAGVVTAVDSDITASDAVEATDDGSLTNPVIPQDYWVRWHTTSISGTPTSVTVTVWYKVNNQ